MRIGRHRATADFRINGSPTSFGVFFGLKDENRRPFAEHKTVAILVVGAGCSSRFVVTGRQRVHRRKRSDGKRVDDGFGATADNYIREASAQVVDRVRD